MAQTAAEAVIDQRLKTLETMCENLTRRVEVMKVVMRMLAREAGEDWRKLVGKAAGEIEARNARKATVA